MMVGYLDCTGRIPATDRRDDLNFESFVHEGAYETGAIEVTSFESLSDQAELTHSWLLVTLEDHTLKILEVSDSLAA